MKYLILYLLAAVVFFAIDIAWLGWAARNFYREKLSFILSDHTNWAAAIVFYLVYIGGILYFATVPALKVGEWSSALLNGALFGFFCYATYDLTNMATIKDWPVAIVIVDILWGMVLTGSVALAAFFLGNRLLGL